MSKDLTMQEVIADSMIALVNAADGIDQQSFAHLLENVALKLAAKGGKYSAGSASAACKPTATR